jgi:hypothetical protein
MQIRLRALALLGYIAALAAAWFLLDERWRAPISLVLALSTIAVSVHKQRRSGEPWISKNPDDYR